MSRSSFRDPAGKLHLSEGRILREISPSGMTVLRSILACSAARELTEEGKLVKTIDLSIDGDASNRSLPEDVRAESQPDAFFVEHERVWFPSYPYEWPPEMLFAAGELTIELAESMLQNSVSLKDATPYNVLFSGPKPVFVDVLSFEQRDPGDPRWLPYGQFVRTFVLPLLMARRFGTSLAETFLTHRDGLEPEQVYPYASWLQRLTGPCLTTVSIPTWLGRRVKHGNKKLYDSAKPTAPDKADFILRAQLSRARKLLGKVRPAEAKNSTWSSYTNSLSYTAEQYGLKQQLLRNWLTTIQPASVLDVGCNTGQFSQIAAESGARVVAVDFDPVVVGLTWKRARANRLDILPLVVNLAWPTPSIGWRNAEYPSFLDRALGSFETVMMLAVVHHLLVSERIPLQEIVRLCHKLTTKYLIIEYVSKQDEMFEQLTRGRSSLHADFTQKSFEAAFSTGFAILDKAQVKGDLRWLYLLRKTTG